MTGKPTRGKSLPNTPKTPPKTRHKPPHATALRRGAATHKTTTKEDTLPAQIAGMTPERAERAQKVVEMKHRQGLTLEKIAEKLGISETQTRRDYRDAIDATFKPTVEQFVMEEVDRLQLVYQRFLPDMLQREDHDRAFKAGEKVLKVSEQRAKLLGLNAAVKFEVKGERVSELDTLAQAVAAEVAALEKAAAEQD